MLMSNKMKLNIYKNNIIKRMKIKFKKSQVLEPTMTKNKSFCGTCHQTFVVNFFLKNHNMEWPMIECKSPFPL